MNKKIINIIIVCILFLSSFFINQFIWLSYKLKVCNNTQSEIENFYLNSLYFGNIWKGNCIEKSIIFYNKIDRKINFSTNINNKDEFFQKNPLDNFDILKLKLWENTFFISDLKINEWKNQFILRKN
jgi:hypothetical protein